MRWLVLIAMCFACDRDTRRVEIDLSREHDSAITLEGVSFTTVFEVDANEQAPLLVMLHGLGDTAKNFREAWPAIPFKLQLSFPLAPLPIGNGRQWFDWPPGTDEESLGRLLDDAEQRLWPAIVKLARGRKVMVGGFSQGGMMAYVMALRHPDEVIAAIPIGGRIPLTLVPARARTAPIIALHGDADRRISIVQARESIAALKAAGSDATLHEYPGVGHTITPAMFERLIELVRERR